MEFDLSSTVILNNGVKIPLLGLGTYKLWGKTAVKAVSCALNAGYRHIDTAWAYGNEKRVGEGIKNSGIDRDDVFITTKLWNSDHGYSEALRAVDKSLNNLGVDHVDLYLIHWPIEGYIQTWKALEKLLDKGKVRAIGVSNFKIHHLKPLLADTSTIPTVNQVEFTPYLYQKELYQFCTENNIRIEAYSPLTRGTRLQDTELIKIAGNYGKTGAQILIRWGLQHGLVEIPKSKREGRIIENSEVFDFEISAEDMVRLNQFHENLRVIVSGIHDELVKKYLTRQQ